MDKMGTRNTLGDLNNILFETLERLNDGEVKGEELEEEMDRARAISGVAKDVVSNASLALEARKFKDDRYDIGEGLPRMLEG